MPQQSLSVVSEAVPQNVLDFPQVTDTYSPAESGETFVIRESGRKRRFRLWSASAYHPAFLVVLSLLPFWLLPVSHLASDPGSATGFYHEELPYYVANGRAAFERGNGIAYPNPYDPDPAAPAIYAHWLLWVMGLLPVYADSDPGDVMIAFTFISTIIFGFATWKLVAERVLHGSSPHLPYLIAMWGGGLLVIAGFIADLAGNTDPVSSLLQFDPGRGLWFLNWGRNAIFATESVYHCLVAACWVCEMRGQRLSGTLWCAALATTHPWSGLQLLLILNTWRVFQWYRIRDRTSGVFLVTAILMLAVFLVYYKVWLPHFDQHRRLQDVWKLDWSLASRSAILAYSLVAIPAIVRICKAVRHHRSGGSLPLRPDSADADRPCDQGLPGVTSGFTRAEQFLICALFVSVGLVFHDRLIRPIQPLHFTRGYIWMPLFLLGLPTVQVWGRRAFRSGLAGQCLAAGLCLALFVDNAAFALIHSRWLYHSDRGYQLNSDDRAMLVALHRRCPAAVVLTESDVINYLLPTYANVRPWIGHLFNTPDRERRLAVFEAVFAGNSVIVEQIPAEVDVLVIRRSRDSSALVGQENWVPLESNNAGWTFWGRAEAQESQGIATNGLPGS